MALQLIAETIASFSGIICVYLQTKERISAWPFGILSVGISAIIFYNSKLYSDVILHVCYVFLNLYGWYHWARLRRGDLSKMLITSLTKMHILMLSMGLIVLTFFWGYIMKSFTDADLVYFDAFTTVGSLIAQFLLTRKIIENWILWIVIDLVAVNMYIYKGLYLIAFLFFVYLLICVKGLNDWRKIISS
jgi:nicotinamide mononucleotide transporter